MLSRLSSRPATTAMEPPPLWSCFRFNFADGPCLPSHSALDEAAKIRSRHGPTRSFLAPHAGVAAWHLDNVSYQTLSTRGGERKNLHSLWNLHCLFVKLTSPF